jgi:hypothetical protein
MFSPTNSLGHFEEITEMHILSLELFESLFTIIRGIEQFVLVEIELEVILVTAAVVAVRIGH